MRPVSQPNRSTLIRNGQILVIISRVHRRPRHPTTMPEDSSWGIEGIRFADYESINSAQKAAGRKKIFLTIATALIVTIIVVIMAISDVINAGLETTPEYGYRLDVEPELYEDLGANRYPYISGQEYPDFSTTVFIEGSSKTNSSEYWSGSGVIISLRWVLTAAHVIEDLNPDDTYVAIGSDYQHSEEWYAADSFHIHPGWRGNEELPYGLDIALIELSEPVHGITPSSWANDGAMDDSSLGSVIFTSGFGIYDYEYASCDSACLYDGDEYYSQRRAWGNTLDRIVDGIETPYGYEGKDDWLGGLVAYDFDSPDSKHNSLGNDKWRFTLKQGDYSYAGDGDSSPVPHALEGTAVFGDSGGPTFGKIGGKWVVIGLTSHGSETSDYGDVAFSTRVSSHSDWICSYSWEHQPILGCG